jgi:hypothetical protein
MSLNYNRRNPVAVNIRFEGAVEGQAPQLVGERRHILTHI